MDVRDEMEIDRLGLNDSMIGGEKIQIAFFSGKLQRCREEREKIIREKALDQTSAGKTVDSSNCHS